MKNLLIASIITLTTLAGFSQKKGKVEAKFHVEGICNMCKN